MLMARQQHMARRHPHQIFAVAPDIHILIAVYADASHDEQPRFFLLHVLQNLLKGLSIEQHGFQIDVLFLRHLTADVELCLIDFGQSAIDHFLMELLLFLKPEGLPGLCREHPRNAVKHRVMEIRIKRRNRLNRQLERFRQGNGDLQPPVTLRASIDGHHDPITVDVRARRRNPR